MTTDEQLAAIRELTKSPKLIRSREPAYEYMSLKIDQVDLLLAHIATLTAERAKLLSLAEDLANGYDHEPDAHRYDNGACRKCKGQEILRDYAIEAGEAKGGGDAK